MAAGSAEMVYALVGNPNCGKTTLFNALTGLRQKVGNYPGVTVERKEGVCVSQHGTKLRIIDLPGSYSLNARSPDEAILRDVLLGRRKDTPRPDRIICVVDASNLERNLYLFTQLLELGLPMILVLNMVDVADRNGIRIDTQRLSERFGVPVVSMVASQKHGLTELKLAMSRTELKPPQPLLDALPVPVRGALLRAREALAEQGIISATASPLEPLYLISGHDPTHYGIADEAMGIIHAARGQLEREIPGWEDRMVAARYDAIMHSLEGVLRRPERGALTLTDRIDNVLLHHVWGWGFLIAILGVFLWLIFSAVEGPTTLIESVFEWVNQRIKTWMFPGEFRDLLTQGIVSGVSGVLVFVPQIVLLFLFIGLMEDTGYMARLAFMMDRIMGKVGLSGKSFLPILSSHACAVPGVMAARAIENPRDRLITILVAPLAACSARLPVYLLLIAAMVPAEVVSPWRKGGILLALYSAGLVSAFLFAMLFNKRVLPGKPAPLILELPSYKMPGLATILRQTWGRVWIFIRRAGTVILGLSILLWAASTYPQKKLDPGQMMDKSEALAYSAAGRMGHLIEPLIRPMGADWKIGIGLISSFAAREVFVSTMSVVYSVEAEEDEDEESSTSRLRSRLSGEKHPDGSPVYTPALCVSLLIFFIFAMQCLSTIAVVRRETSSWKWPLFQLAYLTGTGYILAVVAYQVLSRWPF